MMTGMLAGCFHCGEPVPAGSNWTLQVDGAMQPFCCGGCKAVAATILDSGLGAFYRQRDGQVAMGRSARALDEALAEAQRLGNAAAAAAASRRHAADALPVIAAAGNIGCQQEAVRPAIASAIVDTDLAIEGMHCGACVWLVEQGLKGEPGVQKVGVNLATERATVRWSPDQTSVTRLLEVVARLGYRARPYDARTRERDLAVQTRRSLQRLFVAGLGMMQVMMYALPGYMSGGEGIETEYEQLLRWASFALTTPVIFYSAWPFFVGAWQSLRHRRIGIDVPVSIALVAAYLASVHATVTATGEVYFDSVAMFTFLLLLARHAQWLIRRRALAQLDAVGAATPDAVWRIVGDGRELVSPDALVPNDRIDVDTGAMVPVDACLERAETTIDQSILTGESLPVRLRTGEPVAAGSLVTGPPARLRVTHRLVDSAVSRIETMVARGLNDKPRWTVLADRIASWFVVAVLLMAAGIWLTWMQIDPARAWPIAMTVLVVSCPCALSMATPSAIAAVTGSLMRDGILVTRGDALEALAQATDVVFDKTGTLTEGRPALTRVDTDGAIDRLLALRLAAQMEAGVAHPFAQALRREAEMATQHAAAMSEATGQPASAAADASTVDAMAESAAGAAGASMAEAITVTEHLAGRGVAARWRRADGTEFDLRLGSASWCGLDSSDAGLPWPSDPAASEVFLVAGIETARSASGNHHAAAGDNGDNASPTSFAQEAVLARFSLTDPVRATAAAAVAALQASGLQVHLLSGDRVDVAASVAATLGIDRYAGGALPEAKQAAVRQMQSEGRRVVMVGDGMNDAPVLSLADVSVAIGQASDLARTAADVILLASDPQGVATLHERALRARRIIGQNVAWAASYNALAIPLAALGLVPPWAAAVGMAASSWLVVTNAARLWPKRARKVPAAHGSIAPRDGQAASAAGL